MKKKLPAIFLVIAVFLAGVFWLLIKEKTALPRLSQFGNTEKEIHLNGNNFLAEVADTPEKRALGLSGRPELCPECAMLFIFEKPSTVSFWMKDMQFDLDIIWISGNEIIGIAKNVSHERGSAEIVRASGLVDKVVEINAGVSEKLDLKAGDKVDFFKVD